MKKLSIVAKALVVASSVFASAGLLAAPFTYSTDFSAGVGSEWTVTTTFNSNQAGILGQLENGSALLTLNTSGAGTSSLDFDVLGFRTLDGNNCCTDTFQLSINGTHVFSGIFPLGGGGSETIPLNTLGAAVTGSSSTERHITFSSITLLAGVNTILFDYGNLQGFSDEAWGLDNVRMAGTVTPATSTPEPSSLLILGSALALTVVRRRKV